MLNNWNNYNDNNNRDIIIYDMELKNEISNLNNDIKNNKNIEYDQLNIQNIDISLPSKMNTKNIKKMFK